MGQKKEALTLHGLGEGVLETCLWLSQSLAVMLSKRFHKDSHPWEQAWFPAMLIAFALWPYAHFTVSNKLFSFISFHNCSESKQTLRLMLLISVVEIKYTHVHLLTY